MKHTGGDCALCAEKLKDAHPILQEAFPRIKYQFPECHISCTFRDQFAQDVAFNTGHSRLKWPDSPHNKRPALAMDLFQIRMSDKLPLWSTEYYRQIADFCKLNRFNIFWGGWWLRFKDAPHFQVSLDQE